MTSRCMRTMSQGQKNLKVGNRKWSITCCPRQIRGPALKGRKMKGLGVRYLCSRSSRKRSGSNSSAGKSSVCVDRSFEANVLCTIRAPKIFSTMHQKYGVADTIIITCVTLEILEGRHYYTLSLEGRILAYPRNWLQVEWMR